MQEPFLHIKKIAFCCNHLVLKIDNRCEVVGPTPCMKMFLTIPQCPVLGGLSHIRGAYICGIRYNVLLVRQGIVCYKGSIRYSHFFTIWGEVYYGFAFDGRS